MKTNDEQIREWAKEYYHLVYQYAFYICHDRSLAEQVAEQTFLEAYKNVQRIRRSGKPKGWIMQTARYFILKVVYESWKRGENVTEKFMLPEYVDIEMIQSIMKRYEENEGKSTK